MFAPLAGGVGGGKGAADADAAGELPADAAVRAACAAAGAALLPAVGRVRAACAALAALPPDELQALRRALLGAGKLLQASLAEIAAAHALRDDAAFVPAAYDLDAAARLFAALPRDEGAAAAQPPAVEGAGSAEEDDGGDGDDDDDFDDGGGRSLPADAGAALVRTGVAALAAEFAAVKAAQPVVDRLGARLMQLQAASRAAAAAEEAPPANAAATAAAADGLHAALGALKDGVIDLAAAVDEVDAGADLHAAVRASAAGAASLVAALEAAEADAAAAAAPDDAAAAAALPAVRAHLARAAAALDALALAAPAS
jgi:hypothetical protein